MRRLSISLFTMAILLGLIGCDQLPLGYKAGSKIHVTYQTIYGTAPEQISRVIDPETGVSNLTYTNDMLPPLDNYTLSNGQVAEFGGWQKDGTKVTDGVPIGSNDVLNAIWNTKIGYQGEITYTTDQQLVPTPTAKVVFGQNEAGTYGNSNSRIPTLLVLPSGTLLAFADRRYEKSGDIGNDDKTKVEVWCKRSEDNGDTWKDPVRVTPQTSGLKTSYGDAGVVYDKTSGHILALVIGQNGLWYGTPEDPSHIWVVRSKDEGRTWEAPVDITHFIFGKDCPDPVRKNWGAGFVASGNGTQLSSGRLMFSIAVRTTSVADGTKSGQLQNFALFSDDGGYTWQLSDNSPTANGPVGESGLTGCGDEAKIVELSDGRLYMQIRPNNTPTWHRRISYSYDQGKTWTDAEIDTQLPSSASNGDLMYYTSTAAGWDKDRLLCAFDTQPYNGTNNMNKVLGFNGQELGKVVANKNLGYPAFFISYDDGKTWQGRIWHEGSSAYSSFNILNDGSIGVLVEHGSSWGNGNIYFFRTNVEWITNGADKGPVRVKN